MTKKLLKLFFSILLISSPLFAKSNHYFEGVSLFNIKKFNEAKFKFEQEIVFNPKSEMAYLYLSKIAKKFDQKKIQEKNLNTVILLNPNNEEATFYLAKLKLENSDYEKSKELNNRLSLFCNKFCEKSKQLRREIENLSKK